MKQLLILTLVFGFISCAKSSNEIKREQKTVYIYVRSVDVNNHVDSTSFKIVKY